MNAGAAKILADELLLGLAETLTSWAPETIAAEVLDIGDTSPPQLEEELQRYPIVLRARLRRGHAVALLIAAPQAAALASTAAGAEATGGELGAAAIQALQERVEPLFTGAVAAVAAVFNLDMAVTEAEVVQNPEEIATYMGGACTVARFRFSGPASLQGDALLVYSQTLEDLCPASLYSDEESAQLSEEEMNSILSGLEVAPAGASKAAKPTATPPNLDMILDINLVVTARLGRVELPLQEILSLGPGSIIEVGHLVDEPVELLVNNKLIARGDVVVVDEKFGLRITEIVSARERIESLR